MRSYLVLTPPGGPDRNHRDTLVLRDGFSWIALFFPWIWLLWNRLWIAGLLIFLVQGASIYLMSTPQFSMAGTLLGFAASLLVALEGRHYRSEALIRHGWRLDAVITAPGLDTAEEIYFSGLSEPEKQPMPTSAEWAKQPASGRPTGWNAPNLGLFDHHGGR